MTCLAVIALIGAASAAFWWLATAQLRDRSEGWIAERRAEGFTISFAGVSSGGTPWAPHVAFVSPAIASPPGAASWRLSGERIEVAISVPRLDTLVVHFVGDHRLEVAAGPDDSASIVAAETTLTTDMTSARKAGASTRGTTALPM